MTATDKPTTPRRFRCSKGHEWEEPGLALSHVLSVENERYCTQCIADILRRECGTVAEVKS